MSTGWGRTLEEKLGALRLLQLLLFFVNLLQLFSFAYDQRLFPIVSFFQSNDISVPYMLRSFCAGGAGYHVENLK